MPVTRQQEIQLSCAAQLLPGLPALQQQRSARCDGPALAAVISESRPAAALNHYTFALQLDPRCGVKKDKERLERHLRNSH
jgi:hypothetical protein